MCKGNQTLSDHIKNRPKNQQNSQNHEKLYNCFVNWKTRNPTSTIIPSPISHLQRTHIFQLLFFSFLPFFWYLSGYARATYISSDYRESTDSVHCQTSGFISVSPTVQFTAYSLLFREMHPKCISVALFSLSTPIPPSLSCNLPLFLDLTRFSLPLSPPLLIFLHGLFSYCCRVVLNFWVCFSNFFLEFLCFGFCCCEFVST